MQKPSNNRISPRTASGAPARPVPKRAASARARKRSGSNVALILALALALTVGAYFVESALPSSSSDTSKVARVPIVDVATTIRITEVMASNSSAIQDDKGAYSDWIEITNVSKNSVNLKGWKLAKSVGIMNKFFEFPNHTLAPGARTLVFCTNTTSNAYGYGYHAPFKISAAGDTLLLYNTSDTAVQSLNLPEMKANQSYAELNGEWVLTGEFTPGLENTAENHRLIASNRQIAESPICVTELMAKNVTYAPDENGEYLDWIELYNSSSYAVSLNGFTITDSSDNLAKWRFPNVSIGPGEYLLIYASGYDRRNAGSPLHTNFRLSTEKEGVILSNASGQIIDIVEYDLLKADQSYSRQADDSWTTMLSPTPGMSNSFASAALIDGQFAARNTIGVFINEVVASSTSSGGVTSHDWLELRNTTGTTIDLAGFGLSDDPTTPRKWQFPEGAQIAAGQYMGVLLSGINGFSGGYYNTDFKLSASEGETLVLSMPDGTIIDRVSLGRQYANISYGRISDRSGFYYLTASTPRAANVTSGYESRVLAPGFSDVGGMYPAGTYLMLTLECEEGATIYYTLDCSDPDPAAVGGKTFNPDPEVSVNSNYRTYVYTNPIQISKTTVVRAMAQKQGQLPSLIQTHTYFVGVQHSLQVVSLVTSPVNLWDYNSGIYVKGPNATAKSPYGSANSGANFWMDWEKSSNVELYDTDGAMVLSQGCGVMTHGAYSRADAQKALRVIARGAYGVNRFYADLFPNRDYTEYQSFILRASGQDSDQVRFRDALMTSLAEGTSVMYQDVNMAVLYLNGEYWGHYNLRERINTYSICQWEGWDLSLRDSIDLIKANTRPVMQGSNEEWLRIRDWIEKNGIETAEELAYVDKYIDLNNYMEYVAIQMFTGNTDLLNVKKYRCAQTDGKWRWILFDMDTAFLIDTNSVGRWLAPGGVGSGNKTDNLLFVELMKNSAWRDKFLTYFAQRLRTDWATDAMLARMEEMYNQLAPELDMQLERWNVTRSTYDRSLSAFKTYAKNRPGRLLYSFYKAISKDEMLRYFGDLLETIPMLDPDKKVVEFK